MKKGRRIMAILALVVLAGLYIVTMVAALLSKEAATPLFQACLVLTIAFPILIYAYQMVYRVFTKKNDTDQDDN